MLFAFKYGKLNYHKEVKPYSINEDESESLGKKWHSYTVLLLDDFEKINNDANTNRLIKICLTNQNKDNFAVILQYPNPCKSILDQIELLEENDNNENQISDKLKIKKPIHTDKILNKPEIIS